VVLSPVVVTESRTSPLPTQASPSLFLFPTRYPITIPHYYKMLYHYLTQEVPEVEEVISEAHRILDMSRRDFRSMSAGYRTWIIDLFRVRRGISADDNSRVIIARALQRFTSSQERQEVQPESDIESAAPEASAITRRADDINVALWPTLTHPMRTTDNLPQEGQVSVANIRQQVQDVIRIVTGVTSVISSLDSAADFHDAHLQPLVQDIIYCNINIYDIYRRSQVLPETTYQVLLDAQMEGEDRFPSDDIIQSIFVNARQNTLPQLTRGILTAIGERRRNITLFARRTELFQEHAAAALVAPGFGAFVDTSPNTSDVDDSTDEDRTDVADDTEDDRRESQETGIDLDAARPETSQRQLWEIISPPGVFPHASAVWQRIDDVVMTYIDHPYAVYPVEPRLLSVLIGDYVVERQDDDGNWTAIYEEEDLNKEIWIVR
jgi:hypothetical protein